MSLACPGNAQGLLHVSFNQDGSCLALATREGLRIFSVDAHAVVYKNPLGAIRLAEMLFSTSLVAYAGAGEQPALTPRRLTVFNTSSGEAIQHISFASSVLGVLINRQRLVVVLERRANVYALQSLEHLRTLETPPNPRGLGALTPAAEPGDPDLLALPSSASGGALTVYDLASDGGNAVCEISAHKAPLAALAWSRDGALLATASTTGTVVRVHALQPGASRLFSFRRGATPATVHCLAFSPPGVEPRLLAAASSHGTVHLFRLEAAERHPALAAASAAVGLLAAVVKLPVTDMVDPVRNIITVRLPCHNVPCICALQRPSGGGGGEAGAAAGLRSAPSSSSLAAPAAGGGGLTLLVATAEGLLYEYALDDLANPQGPTCALGGEWALLGSAGLGGGGG
ncbi:autophagy 18 related protein [Raphidocelis subcapitata]|uniref:Autophagy 18 related protein n=1 Tax=Raphidocelis subcapitata TaxID=307507 RepID=A0A2V0NUE2_9CHLO|nr:autophagy 18 related protein [Raphidocelis subcapitata]|eukprot:GBF88547.1 autophagy 18 related protein [Raphidocelis subcapitata]